MGFGLRLGNHVAQVNGRPDPVELELQKRMVDVCAQWDQHVDQSLELNEAHHQSKKARRGVKRRATRTQVETTLNTLSPVGLAVPIVSRGLDKE